MTRFAARLLIAIGALALALTTIACDRMANAEIRNESSVPLVVSVNGSQLYRLMIDPNATGYASPGVNTRLKRIEISSQDDPSDARVLDFNTFSDTIVVIVVKGPPLSVEVVHR